MAAVSIQTCSRLMSPSRNSKTWRMRNVTSTSVAGDAEHLADDRARHLLLEHERVVGDELVDRLLRFGAEVRGEEAVEVAGRILALSRRAGNPTASWVTSSV